MTNVAHLLRGLLPVLVASVTAGGIALPAAAAIRSDNPGVIAVGATARDGKLAVFTSARSYVALTAPGAGDMPDVPVSGGRSADPAAGLTAAASGGGYQSLASTDMSAALTTSAAPRATSGRADPGHLLRSLVTGLVIVAVALIACLTGVTALTTRRRRSRSADRAALATKARQGHRGRARHARERSGAPAARVQPVTGPWPGVTGRRAPLAEEPPWPPALPPGSGVPHTPPPARTRPTAHSRPPAHARPPARALPPPRALPPARALPPVKALPPAKALPAAQPEARPADTPLAPWEQSPAEFATAPPPPDVGSWPVSSTGPMYVWNPAATTAPLPVVEDDEVS